MKTLGVAQGIVAQTLTVPQVADIASVRSDRIELVWGGVSGDRHCGQTKLAGGRESEFAPGTCILNVRQVSVLSSEESETVAGALGIDRLRAEDLGANLVLSGVPDLSQLQPLTTLWFSSGAVLLVTSINQPCKLPGRLLQAQHPQQENLTARFTAAARDLRGLVAMVQHPGPVATGDRVVVRAPKPAL